MIDINRHKFFLVQILKDIYSDIELANCLGFKGGTALMFFYGLPRFSVDLDFNLINKGKEEIVYEIVRKILLKYGTIYDEAPKFYGPLIVLDYGTDERKLKVEISNRMFENRYEIKNLLGINMKVMVLSDMFAHKLCALLDRNSITGRDIFDCWFFLKNQSPVNKAIVESRMHMSFTDYEDLSFAWAKLKAQGAGHRAQGKELKKELAELGIESFKKNLEMFRSIVPVKTICMHGSPVS